MAVLLIDCVPDCLDVDSDEDGFVVTVPVLEGVGGHKIMTLDVRLSPMPSMGADTFEFTYGFTITDLDEAELSYFTQDRYEVERYFEGHSRQHVLPTVCACLEELVDHVQPGFIYRVTKGRDLPQKAIEKYFLVTDTLLGLGFAELQTGTDGFNRTFWVMGR